MQCRFYNRLLNTSFSFYNIYYISNYYISNILFYFFFMHTQHTYTEREKLIFKN